MFVVRLDKGGDFGVEGQRLVGALAFDKDAKARMSCRPGNEHEHDIIYFCNVPSDGIGRTVKSPLDHIGGLQSNFIHKTGRVSRIRMYFCAVV